MDTITNVLVSIKPKFNISQVTEIQIHDNYKTPYVIWLILNALKNDLNITKSTECDANTLTLPPF